MSVHSKLLVLPAADHLAAAREMGLERQLVQALPHFQVLPAILFSSVVKRRAAERQQSVLTVWLWSLELGLIFPPAHVLSSL